MIAESSKFSSEASQNSLNIYVADLKDKNFAYEKKIHLLEKEKEELSQASNKYKEQAQNLQQSLAELTEKNVNL